MSTPGSVLGVDIGSVSVTLAEVDAEGRILWSGSAVHQGRSSEIFADLLDPSILERVHFIAATSATPDAVKRSLTGDSQVAFVAAAKRLHPDLRSLLVVGGEKFSLTRFDARGEYLETTTNSSCAAGTGSFLDQQARALGLGGSASLAAEALKATGTPPKIASRCAVFAKTDLIHAQQEGHGRPEICDGLCRGLANIVADTLVAGSKVEAPVVLAGGVARSRAVRMHLEERLGSRVRVDRDPHLYGALGAALTLLEKLRESDLPEIRAATVRDVVSPSGESRSYHYPPLTLRLSTYPRFCGLERYEFSPARGLPVEMDVYVAGGPGEVVEARLGVDIGSTSTKAVLLSGDGEVLVGAYTRTAGRPIVATQSVLEALESWAAKSGLDLRVVAAGTTGSGRNLVGAVLGADLVVDEITAHARAAYELDPETDTILEIGGQDAKFTTLRNGMVTSAVMNTVCAAGTGSFIEEQARILECPLEEYADAVAGARAPLTSDRCTVFMQRDINHLMSRGYSVNELLAAVLHSVRENYLQKVAREGNIGDRICFQGATAKNRALVAAFEQRLGKPIRVSNFCHLTGALGVAHLLAETAPTATAFRGLGLWRERIPVRNEVCDLCRNHCKLVVAEVMGETAAYGFLCGRDYDAARFVADNASGFELLRTRRRISRPGPALPPRFSATVGIPATLHLFDELPLWRDFFRELGVRVVTSEKCEDPVGKGKRLANAEFCAPMAAWHGHVDHLLARTDYVFAPVYLESRDREPGGLRQYCYYSQFASALAATREGAVLDGRVLRPVIRPGLGDVQSKVRLYSTLKPVLGEELSLARVAAAYSTAVERHRERRMRLVEAMERELAGRDDVAVVLLGRPYNCLDPRMNKGIPDILGSLGVKTFFQDMLPREPGDTEEIEGLLDQVHWRYAASILSSARVAARTPGLYPVLVTTFKCAPDSFTIEFFRRILDREGKPYLVLELDEHGSSVGYETRIEAAVRSFRNHRESPAPAPRRALPAVPRVVSEIGDRTLFLPNWDRLSCSLLAANLRREGVDAHVLEEEEMTIRRSLRTNTGQCIPLNAILQGFVDEVTALDLDPGRAALWLIDSKLPCNIGMYPGTTKAMLEAHGRGFERAAVYSGDISCIDISVRTAVNTYFAYMFGGMLRRMACRIRPYEVVSGETDAAVEDGLGVFLEAFEGDLGKRDAVRSVVDRFLRIETRERDRPKVAIFGDLYVRDNEVMNQGLVRFIELHGGEVITTPYSEYVKIIAGAYLQRWFREGKILTVVVNGSLLWTAKVLEKQFSEEFARVLGPFWHGRPRRSEKEQLAQFGVTDLHSGESVDNILKICHILETDPDVSLFVQANPSFCCPALVTEAMAGRIRKLTGVPVVTVTYDGTTVPKNDVLIPYLTFPRSRTREERLEDAATRRSPGPIAARPGSSPSSPAPRPRGSARGT